MLGSLHIANFTYQAGIAIAIDSMLCDGVMVIGGKISVSPNAPLELGAFDLVLDDGRSIKITIVKLVQGESAGHFVGLHKT